MFRITNAQYEAFQAEALTSFEAAMLERASVIAPALAAVLGQQGMLRAIRAAVARAEAHGFTTTGPVRLFVELSFLLGSAFDSDVQLPFARESLGDGDPSTQAGRSLTLHGESVEALRRLDGPEGSHRGAALRKLRALLAAPPEPRADDLSAVVFAEMERIYPEKYAYVGEPALRSLLAASEAKAASYGLSEPRDVALVALLMFAFGQGAVGDPLYPWIGRALSNDSIKSPSLRAEQLREKALLWIRAVLSIKEVGS